MEFMDATLSMTADGDTVRLPRTPIQPIAAADVAGAVAEVAAGGPLNGVVNIAGPDVYPLDELGRLALTAKGDGRFVITDDTAGLFAAVHGDVLTARSDARIAPPTTPTGSPEPAPPAEPPSEGRAGRMAHGSISPTRMA